MFELRNDREIPYFHRKLRNSLQNQQSYITFLLFYILNYNVSLEIYLPSYSRMKNKTKKKKTENVLNIELLKKKREGRNSKIEAPCRIIAATSPSAKLSRRCLPQPLHKHRNLQHGRRTGSCRSNYENSHTS